MLPIYGIPSCWIYRIKCCPNGNGSFPINAAPSSNARASVHINVWLKFIHSTTTTTNKRKYKTWPNWLYTTYMSLYIAAYLHTLRRLGKIVQIACRTEIHRSNVVVVMGRRVWKQIDLCTLWRRRFRVMVWCSGENYYTPPIHIPPHICISVVDLK